MIAQTIYITQNEGSSDIFIKYLQETETSVPNDNFADKDFLLRTIDHDCQIENIQYTPKHIFVCCLIGCKKHHSDCNVFSLRQAN